jgi:hypothetical protein
MRQPVPIPKHIVALTFLVFSLTFTAAFIGLTGPDSLLIPPDQISLIRAVPVALLTFAIGGLVVIAWTHFKWPELLVAFVLLFLLELILAVWTAFFFHLDDEWMLHQWATEIAWEGIHGWSYSVFLATIYSVYGTNLMAGKVINSLVTALLPFLAFSMARSLFSDTKIARNSFYWCCFNVPLLLYGAFSLKESLTAFLLMAALWGMTIPKSKAIAGLGVAIGCALALTATRPIYAAIVMLGMTVYVLSPGHVSTQTGIRWLAAGIFMALGILLANQVFPEVQARLSLDYLRQLQEGQTFAGQILTSTDSLAPSSILIAGVGGIYAPPPIRLLLGVGDLLETITMITWYIILPFSVVGWLRAANIPLRNALAITVLVGSFITAASLIFAGVPHRHRVPLFPLLCAMAGDGQPTCKQRRWFYAWWLSIFIFNALYWYLRGSLA